VHRIDGSVPAGGAGPEVAWIFGHRGLVVVLEGKGSVMDERKLYAVCDYMVFVMAQEGQFLNSVKLQRLLYVAYAWYLAFHNGKRLFPAHFEAWKFGPVNRSVHDRFAGHSGFYTPLAVGDRYSVSVEAAQALLTSEEQEHLDSILSIYGEMSAFELEDMLQHEDPWRIARIGLDPDEESSREIADEVILAYYSRVAQL